MTILLEVLITACLYFLLPVDSAPEENIKANELVVHQKEITKEKECDYLRYLFVPAK